MAELKFEISTSFNGYYRFHFYQSEGEGYCVTDIFSIDTKIHEFKRGKSDSIKMDSENYQKVFDAIIDINFAKLVNETPEIYGLDGYNMIVNLKNGSTNCELHAWCPGHNKDKPETKKLLDFCKMVFKMFSLKLPIDI